MLHLPLLVLIETLKVLIHFLVCFNCLLHLLNLTFHGYGALSFVFFDSGSQLGDKFLFLVEKCISDGLCLSDLLGSLRFSCISLFVFKLWHALMLRLGHSLSLLGSLHGVYRSMQGMACLVDFQELLQGHVSYT